MAIYESQRIKDYSQKKTDPFADLLQMVSQIKSIGSKQESYRRAGVENMYNAFSKGASSFDNIEVQDNLTKMEEYFSDNSSNMSADEIDMHNLLKDKLKQQALKNNEFDADNQRRHSFGTEMMKFADEYIEADNVRNFTWKTSSINDQGQMVDEDNIVSLPNSEDYDGGESNLQFQKDNNKAIADLGGLEGYARKRESNKFNLKNQIQKQIGSYGEYQGNMIEKYGASGRLTNYHLKEFSELDESYGFIIDSMEDDGLFDDEEKAVYQSAIMQKSSRPIDNFITKDKEVKDFRRTQLLKDMKLLKDEGDRYEKHQNAVMLSMLDSQASEENRMTEAELQQQAILIPKNTQYNTTSKDESYRYEDLLNLDKNPDLAGYVASLETNMASTKQLLKNKDSSYMKNDGGSFLAGMEEKGWSATLHEEPEGYMPKIYGKKKVKITDDKDEVTIDEKKSPPKYSISLDTSNKIEKSIGKVLKPKEHDESVKTSNIVSKTTGEKMDIVSYDKNSELYTDSEGNKFPREAIVVTSIDDIKPKIKIANGEAYFFNPISNKVEKWADNKDYKNQKIEKMVINGRVKNVPVIRLSQWTEGGFKLYWIDGKWKPLKRTGPR